MRAIAEQLNQSSYRTRYGKAFHPMGVQRLLPQLAEAQTLKQPAPVSPT